MAGCETCRYYRTESSDDEYSAHTWPVCEKSPQMANLKSFPFKKEMSCFALEFWHSEFADLVDDDDENYEKALRLFQEKYP